MAIEEVELFIEWKTESGEANWLFFDAVEAVNHTLAAEYTTAPREDGTPVAEHAFNLPDSVSISGVVSNTPLPSNPNVGSNKDELPGSPSMEQKNIPLKVPKRPLPKSIGSLAVTGATAVTDAAGITEGLPTEAGGVWVGSTYLDRVQAAFNSLRIIKSSFFTCSIRTPLWTYKRMQIKSLSVPEIPSDGSTRTFSIQFEQAIIGTTSTVEAPEPSIIRALPPKKKTAAKKDAKNGDEKEAKKVKESLALKGGVGLANFLGLGG